MFQLHLCFWCNYSEGPFEMSTVGNFQHRIFCKLFYVLSQFRENLVDIVQKFIKALEFSTEVLMEAQDQTNNIINNLNQAIENSPEGTCQSKRKREFKMISHKFEDIKRVLLSSNSGLQPRKVFPDVADYSHEVRRCSQEFFDLFSSQMEDIVRYQAFSQCYKLCNCFTHYLICITSYVIGL